MAHGTRTVTNPQLPSPPGNGGDWRNWGTELVRVLKSRMGLVEARLNETSEDSLVSAVTVTGASYQIQSNDALILVNQTSVSPTIYLPDATFGKEVTIKDIGGVPFRKPIVITATGRNINGQTAVALAQAYGSVTLHCDGTNWFCDPFSLLNKGFNVNAFGAKGDGFTDDTAAIQEAETVASGSSRDGTTIETHVLSFGNGDYLIHELSIFGRTAWEGQGALKTFFTYNGAGGPGSYMIKNLKNTDVNVESTCPGLVLRGFRLRGWRENTSTPLTNPIVETAIDFHMTGMDWGHIVEHVAIENCFGDAIKFSNLDNQAILVNMHLDKLRFDGVGGHCIYLSGSNFSENRPVVIRDTTSHHHFIGDYGNALRAQGLYSGSTTYGDANYGPWGRGFLRIGTAKGVNLHIDTARFEMDPPFFKTDGISSLILVDDELAEGVVKISMTNVNGFCHPRDALTIVHDRNSYSVAMTCNHSSFDSVTYWYRSPVENILYRPASLSFTKHAIQGSFDGGIFFDGQKVEFRDDLPGPLVESFYRPGDLVFRNYFSAANTGPNLGWRVEGADGYYNTRTGGSPQGTGSINSGSTALTLNNFRNILNRFPIGMWITVAGAGAAAGLLTTKITAVNHDTGVLTVSVAASTTVANADIRYVSPTFVETPGPRFQANVNVVTNDNPTLTLHTTATVEDGFKRAHIVMKDGDLDGWQITYASDEDAEGGSLVYRTLNNDVINPTNVHMKMQRDGRVLFGGDTNVHNSHPDFGQLGLPVYNVAGLPSNSDGRYNGNRYLVAVIDGDGGEHCLAVMVGDGGGATWRKIPLDPDVSTTQKPRKLPQIATASLPAASSWKGHIVYDTTSNTVKYSDGANWISM